MKPLSRRLFMKVASAAPFAAKQAAAETAKQAGVLGPVGDVVQGASEGGPVPVVSTQSLKLIGLAKTGMLPDWFLRDRKRIARETARRLDLDLAAMRSMSVAAKVTIQRERNFDRGLKEFTQDLLDERARGLFFGWIKQ